MANSPEFQRKLFNVPPRYRDIVWDDLTLVTDAEKQFAKEYVDKFPKLDRQSIYLSNKVSGSGKTGFAFCLAFDLIEAGKLRTYPYFVSFSFLMEKLRQDRGSIIDASVFKEIMGADFVIFDDIGVEDLTTSVARRYYMLLEQLWLYQKACIFTSKFTLNELVTRAESNKMATVEDELLTSIASRLVGMCMELELENEQDFRNT